MTLFYSNVSTIKYLQITSTITSIFLMFQGFEYYWWLLSIFVYFCTGCLGITITYHRYIAHKSFKMPRALEYLFSFFGAIGGTGSTIGWLAVHNMHHKFSDLDKDPHSPHTLGLRMLLTNYNYKFNPLDARSLLRDSFHVFLHQYYNLILLGWAIFLLLLDIKFFFFVFIVPTCIQIWASNLSNFFNHISGYSNFNTNDNSKNTWWISLITWGEGWHNNHHAEPWKYTFQKHWWELDISAYVIFIIVCLTNNKESLQNSKF